MNQSLMVSETPSSRQSHTNGQGATIEEMLENSVLQRATILAGKNGTTRTVLGVLPIEVPEASVWLKGGELVITVGYALREGIEPWLAFLKNLIEARAAGLLVLASPYIKLIPQEAIDYAEERQFPLLVTPNTGPLLDLVTPIQACIDASYGDASLEGLQFQRRLMQMVLDSSGLEAIARFVARQLDLTLLIEDRQFNLLAYSQIGTNADATLDELIANKGTPVALMKKWEEDGTLNTLRKDKSPVQVSQGNQNDALRLIYPVIAGGETFGFLSLLAHGTPTPTQQQIIEIALSVVAVELLKQRGATESEQKMKRDFFRDLLLANTAATAETMRRRANYLGTPLSSQYWVINVEFDDVKNDESLPEDVNRLVGILNALLSFRQAIVVNQAQGASILYPVKEGQPTQEKIRQLARAIHQKVSSAGPNWNVSIGVGQHYPDLMSVPKAYKEAQHALKIGRSTNGSGAITFFSELGIYRMLLQFSQSQDPNEFFCEPLQRLIEYNQQTDKELVKTIAAFLECNGNLTETSCKLFIHRNTLKYRLERIRDITQIDLDDAENRLMLHLGLKMNQVINYLA